MKSTTKHLEKMNRIFADAFGFEGEFQRIRWFDTFHSHMRYFVERDSKDLRIHGPSGLTLMETQWEKHHWGEIYGNGFVVGIYRPPLSPEAHDVKYGGKAPYQEQGHYDPIENTKREPHEAPNEIVTNMLVKLITAMVNAGAQLDGTYAQGKLVQICPTCGDEVQMMGVTCDYCGQVIEDVQWKGDTFLEALAAQHKAEADEVNRVIADEIDDTFTAFMKVPGKRGGSVSFGGI